MENQVAPPSTDLREPTWTVCPYTISLFFGSPPTIKILLAGPAFRVVHALSASGLLKMP